VNSPIFDVLLTVLIITMVLGFFHKSIVNILKDPKELFTIVAFWLVLGLLLFFVIDYFRSQ
jgi:Kef-type K+ transport system membrane component KefB